MPSYTVHLLTMLGEFLKIIEKKRTIYKKDNNMIFDVIRIYNCVFYQLFEKQSA